MVKLNIYWGDLNDISADKDVPVSAVLEAEKAGVPTAFITRAKLLWDRGDHKRVRVPASASVFKIFFLDTLILEICFWITRVTYPIFRLKKQHWFWLLVNHRMLTSVFLCSTLKYILMSTLMVEFVFEHGAYVRFRGDFIPHLLTLFPVVVFLVKVRYATVTCRGMQVVVE